MDCPDPDLLGAFLSGRADETEKQAVHDHLDVCAVCAELVAEVARDRPPDPLDSTLASPALDPADSAALPPGETLGRFTIEALLGSGGMGVVYLAHDPALDRRVALKLIRSEHASAAGRARLFREAQALARLTHPNVVTVHEIGVVREQLFIAMEHVAGTTAREWAAARPRSRRAILDLYLQAGRGLAAAHAAGLVHRDFKPTNVLVGDDGRVKVADFGLARVARGEEAADPRDDLEAGRTVGVAGTPAYMAPEQAAGGEVGPASDQYSFCVALHEALTGKRPLTGAKVRGPRALARGLAVDPTDRFPSMNALLAALARSRRRLAVLAGVAVAGAAAVALATRGAATWQPLVRDLPNVYDEKGVAPVFSPDGTALAYASDREDRHRSFRLYVEPLAGGRARPLAVTGASPQELRWTRDGRALLYVDRPTRVAYRVPLEGGEPVVVERGVWSLAECGAGTAFVRRAPEGCPLCSSLVMRDGAGERELWRGAPRDILLSLRCDRDGRRVFGFVSRQATETGAILAVPIDGAAPRVLREGPIGHLGPSLALDERRGTVIHVDHAGLVETSLDGGEPRLLCAAPPSFGRPDVSPDGRTLAVTLDLTTYWLSELGPGGAQVRRIASAGSMGRPLATADGEEVIATRSVDDELQIVAYALGSLDERVLGRGVPWDLTADGTAVIATERGRLVALSRRGAPPRVLAELPQTPAAVVVGADRAVHLTLGGEAWVVPEAGGDPVREAPAPWTLVVPVTGGWRLAAATDPQRGAAVLRVVAPGLELADARARTLEPRGFRLDAERRAVVYAAGTELRRHDIATGAETVLLDRPSVYGFAPGARGDTLFVTEEVGSTRPQLIVNFGDR